MYFWFKYGPSYEILSIYIFGIIVRVNQLRFETMLQKHNVLNKKLKHSWFATTLVEINTQSFRALFICIKITATILKQSTLRSIYLYETVSTAHHDTVYCFLLIDFFVNWYFILFYCIWKILIEKIIWMDIDVLSLKMMFCLIQFSFQLFVCVTKFFSQWNCIFLCIFLSAIYFKRLKE